MKRHILLMVVFVITLMMLEAMAQKVTVGVIAPSMVTAGESFTTTVGVSHVSKLAWAQFSLSYNPQIVNLSVITSLITGASMMTNINNTAGIATVQLEMFTNPIDGPINLTNITFDVIGDVDSSTELKLSNLDLSDYNATTLQSLSVNTTISIASGFLAVNITAPPTGKVNETFTATINIGKVRHIAFAQFTVKYNSSVVKVNSIANNFTDASMMTNINNTAGIATVQLEMFTNPIDGHNSLVVINFTAIGAPGESTNLTLYSVDISDYNAKTIQVTEINSDSITIVIPVSGDITSDGKLTGADYVKFKRVLLALDDQPTIVDLDLNNDGKITGADVIKLKRRMLGLD